MRDYGAWLGGKLQPGRQHGNSQIILVIKLLHGKTELVAEASELTCLMQVMMPMRA